jgi:CRP-like cAMP-binding protein
MFTAAAAKNKRAEPNRNKILANLTNEDYQRLLTSLEPVSFAFGDTIYLPDDEPEHIYFPTTSVISLLYTTEEGATAEVGLVGKEGAIGIALCLGGKTMPYQARVHHPGKAYRLRAEALCDEFERRKSLHDVLLRFTQAFMTQIAQTAVCNCLHAIEKRLCRWLLLTHDCVGAKELSLTQEVIANMLGVRRESVTHAALKLQKIGFISYVRGHITIRDRAGLESRSCECYRIVKREYKRLLD